jgi:hypothetical protein
LRLSQSHAKAQVRIILELLLCGNALTVPGVEERKGQARTRDFPLRSLQIHPCFVVVRSSIQKNQSFQKTRFEKPSL